MIDDIASEAMPMVLPSRVQSASCNTSRTMNYMRQSGLTSTSNVDVTEIDAGFGGDRRRVFVRTHDNRIETQ
jgi:hypothetical protein